MKDSRIAPDLPPFSGKQIILGETDTKIINHIILIGKMMIYHNSQLSVDVLLIKLLLDKNTEKLIALTESRGRGFQKKWSALQSLLINDQQNAGRLA